MTRTFRYGLYGVGRIGRVHGQIVKDQGQIVAAVGDEVHRPGRVLLPDCAGDLLQPRVEVPSGGARIEQHPRAVAQDDGQGVALEDAPDRLAEPAANGQALARRVIGGIQEPGDAGDETHALATLRLGFGVRETLCGESSAARGETQRNQHDGQTVDPEQFALPAEPFAAVPVGRLGEDAALLDAPTTVAPATVAPTAIALLSGRLHSATAAARVPITSSASTSGTIKSGSPISDPPIPLDDGGSGLGGDDLQLIVSALGALYQTFEGALTHAVVVDGTASDDGPDVGFRVEVALAWSVIGLAPNRWATCARRVSSVPGSISSKTNRSPPFSSSSSAASRTASTTSCRCSTSIRPRKVMMSWTSSSSTCSPVLAAILAGRSLSRSVTVSVYVPGARSPSFRPARALRQG